MNKRTKLLLIVNLLIFMSASTHAQFKGLKETFGGFNPLQSNAAHRENEIDKVKVERMDLVKEVNNGKIGGNFEIQFLDGKPTIYAGSSFDPQDYGFTEGWVNPVDGFSEKYVVSMDRPNSHKVKITRKGKASSPLYGILEFNKVYTECSGLPVARSYMINIPNDYFISAESGNNTVLYEYYECRPREQAEIEIKKKNKTKTKTVNLSNENYTTWVLWMFNTAPW